MQAVFIRHSRGVELRLRNSICRCSSTSITFNGRLSSNFNVASDISEDSQAINVTELIKQARANATAAGAALSSPSVTWPTRPSPSDSHLPFVEPANSTPPSARRRSHSPHRSIVPPQTQTNQQDHNRITHNGSEELPYVSLLDTSRRGEEQQLSSSRRGRKRRKKKQGEDEVVAVVTVKRSMYRRIQQGE